jgi:hypothetical protein
MPGSAGNTKQNGLHEVVQVRQPMRGWIERAV